MEEVQITEFEDLEERLDVLEGIVDELKGKGGSKAQQETVTDIQLLTQYVRLEDSLLYGLMVLSREVKSEEDEEQMTNATDKFNELGSDFQDTWTEEVWEIYSRIRDKGKEQIFMDFSEHKTLREVEEMAKYWNSLPSNTEEPEEVATKPCKCIVF